MARIKYTALVESIAGSIQGTTFQRNAYGHTVKAKPAMVNPNRYNQQLRKSNFAEMARAWRELTEADRATWFARAEAYPIPTRLNPDSYLNGFDYFMKWHAIANSSAFSGILADAGTGLATFALATPQLNLVGGTDLFMETIVTSDETDWQATVYATPPIPMGQEFIKFTPRWMAIGDPIAVGEVHFADQYEIQFGRLPVVGEWIGITLKFFRETVGQIVEYSPLQYQVS